MNSANKIERINRVNPTIVTFSIIQNVKLLILLILLGLTFLLATEKPIVIMVSFDGFRYDYMENVDTPHFDFVRENGVKAESLQPVFPSLTFPNHYSLATGAYTGTHGITANTFYNRQTEEVYSMYDASTVQDAKWYGAEPIWVTAERQNIRSASFFWIGSEAPILGIYPSIYKKYNGKIPFKTRVDSVITWLKLPEEIRPQLVMLYFSEPDHTGHRQGPDSPKIPEVVEEMDSILGYLLNQIQTLTIADNINLIIVSDHGMASVDTSRFIVLDDYISQMDDIYVEGDGSFSQIDINSHDYVLTFMNESRRIPHLTAYSKESIPLRFHFINHNTADFLLVADDGWFISTNEYLEYGFPSVRGMHGYDPKSKLMHGIFYAYGTKFKANLQIDSFELIHIYPLVCEILDIKPFGGTAPSYKDKPDGNIRVLKNILVGQD